MHKQSPSGRKTRKSSPKTKARTAPKKSVKSPAKKQTQRDRVPRTPILAVSRPPPTALRGRVGISSKPMAQHRPTAPAGSSRRMRDRVLIESLAVGSTVPVTGDVLWSRRNRCSIPGSYLELMAGMYNRWRIHSYTYEFIPSVGSNFNAQLVGAIDPDPLSVYVDRSTNNTRLSLLTGSCVQQAWLGNKFSHPRTRDSTDLWTKDLDAKLDDYSDRFSQAGNALITVLSVGDLVANKDIGSIFLEYDIEFYDQRLALEVITGYDLLSWPATLIAAIFDKPTMITTESVGIVSLLFSGLGSLLGADGTAEAIQTVSSLVSTWFDWSSWGSLISTPSRSLALPYMSAAPTLREGLPPGRYRIDYYFCSNTMSSPLATHAWDENDATGFPFAEIKMIKSNTDHGNIRILGRTPDALSPDSTIPGITFIHQWVDPTDSGYWTTVLNIFIEFVITSGRGFADLKLTEKANPVSGGSRERCTIGRTVIQFTRNANAQYWSPDDGGSFTKSDELDTMRSFERKAPEMGAEVKHTSLEGRPSSGRVRTLDVVRRGEVKSGSPKRAVRSASEKGARGFPEVVPLGRSNAHLPHSMDIYDDPSDGSQWVKISKIDQSAGAAAPAAPKVPSTGT